LNHVNRRYPFLAGTDTPLKEGDEVSIVPAVAGG